jgi:hypothetical protein
MHIIVSVEMMGDEASSSARCEVAMRGFLLWTLVLACLSVGSAQAGEDPELEAFTQESRAMVKAFAGSLKGELQAAMKEGGPTHAIPVCNVKAPEIARDLSRPLGWTVGRTSHKIRNPGNAPDAWEAAVLDEFLQRAAAGEDLTAMEKAELVQIDGRPAYRYMKAIPVGEICLNCHGSGIGPEVKAQIDSFYPEDHATGFALGELRGAFTITKAAAN